MLESAEPFQVPFDKLDIEDPSYFGDDFRPPNFDDWDKARAFMKFFKIFYDATNFFFNLYSCIHTCCLSSLVQNTH
jgi:hypothetical protein